MRADQMGPTNLVMKLRFEQATAELRGLGLLVTTAMRHVAFPGYK